MNDEQESLRFGFGLKLLVPLLIVSVFGLMAPLLDPRPKAKAHNAVEQTGPRVPYQDELAPLLEDAALLPEQRAALLELHQRLNAAQSQHGGITAADAAKLQRLLRGKR